jgi:ATP/maltotriose-dependent transcriptional regulator MalT
VYLHQESPNDALKLFQLGQIAAQDSGSSLAVSVLCANEAWAYALLGKQDLATQLMNRTKDEFARADVVGAAPWAKFFDETDLHAMIGTVHTVLARTVDRKHTQWAIPALSRAIESYGDDMARSRAFNMATLATNHLLEGDIDQGARVGRQAIESAESLKSSRVKDRMAPLKDEADKRKMNADARELSERLARFFAA